MMTNRISLEKEIIGRFLWQPKELELVDVDKNWFSDKNHQDIMTVLERKNYQERPSRTHFIEELQLVSPNTSVSTAMLEDYQQAGMALTGELEQHINLLQRSYRLRMAQVEAERYNFNPTEENLLEFMETANRYKEFTEEEVDDGSLSGALEEIIDSLEKDVDTGIKTYYELDRKFGGGFKGGMLVTIGAGTGVGKTSFGINLAMEAVLKNENTQVDFFSLEMTKLQMAKKLVARVADVNSYSLENPFRALKEDKKADVVQAAGFLDTIGMRVYDSAYDMASLEVLIRKNQKEAEAKGKEYIAFVDYLQLVDTENKSAQRYIQVGEITRRMKLLTIELNIPIITMSQLSRNVDNREDKKPQLSDLRESGSIEQDSNAVILIHEDDEYIYRGSDGRINPAISKVTMIIDKNRAGATGKINYHHDKSRTHFVELGAES